MLGTAPGRVGQVGRTSVQGGLSVAAYSLNFAADEYKLNGVLVSSPLVLTRADAACRTAADGVTVTVAAANVARRDSRGLYLETDRTRLSTYPTNQALWAIVGTGTTRVAETAVGPLTPVLITAGSAGLGAMISSNTNISLTAGQKVYPRQVYKKTGTSGRSRLRVGQASVSSTISGVLGNMGIADEVAGTWSDIVNVDHGGDWFGVDATFTALAAGADWRLREGPDTATAGQTSIVAWSQLCSLPGEIILGNLTIPVSVAKDQASFDVSAFPPTGFVVTFTLDRIVTAATVCNLKSAAGTSFVQLRAATNGALTAVLNLLGAEVDIDLGTINARQEYTVGIEWRNNVLRGYVDGGAEVSEAFVGAMPAITAAELFTAGGSAATFHDIDLYNRPI